MTLPIAPPLRWRVLPVVAWAILVLALTSVPGSALPHVGVPNVDKAVHFLMYATLAALAARSTPPARRVRSLLAVVACVSLFAAVDEWHQQFIPGRSEDRRDWLADTIGAASGAFLIAAACARRESIS